MHGAQAACLTAAAFGGKAVPRPKSDLKNSFIKTRIYYTWTWRLEVEKEQLRMADLADGSPTNSPGWCYLLAGYRDPRLPGSSRPLVINSLATICSPQSSPPAWQMADQVLRPRRSFYFSKVYIREFTLLRVLFKFKKIHLFSLFLASAFLCLHWKRVADRWFRFGNSCTSLLKPPVIQDPHLGQDWLEMLSA